jgi:DNA invertase Pin-like site-specific DNA recombinase
MKRTKGGRPASRAKRRLRPAAPRVTRARSSDAGEITSKPMLLGYARVSTVDQNLALQRDALTEAGCTKIFTEQMSGAVADRPALHDALEFARSGDTLIVWKLDRLARSMKQLIETVEALRVRGIGFRSLTEALDTTTAQGRLVFHMFGALAEFERSLIRERTKAGLAAARRAGRTGGRPPKLTDDDIEAAKAMLANPDISVTHIADRLGVSPATLYRYIPAAHREYAGRLTADASGAGLRRGPLRRVRSAPDRRSGSVPAAASCSIPLACSLKRIYGPE